MIEKQEGWKKISKKTLPLQGKWLMAGRIKGEEERRRDTNRPRKTMKILLGGISSGLRMTQRDFPFMELEVELIVQQRRLTQKI